MATKPPKDRRGLRIVSDGAQSTPKERLVQLTIRLPLSKRRDLHLRATEYDMSIGDFVQAAIERFMSERPSFRGRSDAK